jgi:hypothetical protein
VIGPWNSVAGTTPKSDWEIICTSTCAGVSCAEVVGIGSETDGIFSADGLRLLLASLSLGEANFFFNRNASANVEGTGLELMTSCCLARLSALLAVGLADLFESCVRDHLESLSFADFNLLPEALNDATTVKAKSGIQAIESWVAIDTACEIDFF